MLFACSADVLCTHSVGWWSTYALLTARNRREGCHLHRTVCASPTDPTCHGLWSHCWKGCLLCLNVVDSWLLVRAAASASAASTAAPGPRGRGASWNWTRWTKNKQPTLVPPCITHPSATWGRKQAPCSVFSLFITHTWLITKVNQASKKMF